MMEDEFDPEKILSLIREKLKIPHYRLVHFIGYNGDFDLSIREVYSYEANIPDSIDTFETGISAIEREKQAIIDIEGKPRHRDLLSHVEENWKNLSILKTVAENESFIAHNDYLHLSAQNLPFRNESGLPLFPYYKKEEFTDLIVDPKETVGWFLFIPNSVRNNLTPDNHHKLINQQGIYFPDTHFGIFYLFFNWRVEEWHYGGWYFATPSENYSPKSPEMWGSPRFPFNDFNWYGDWISEDPQESKMWMKGKNFQVEGGGFYLGPNAEILLDLQSRKHLGILNWWTSLQK